MAIIYSDSLSDDVRSGIHYVLTCLKTALTYTLPVITPVLMASIVSKYQYDMSQEKKRCDSEMMRLAQEMTGISKLATPVGVTERDLLQILKKEEQEELRFLNDLTKVQQGIKKALDYRCSLFDPSKNRFERMKIEDEVFLESPTKFHRGLRNIFQYDHLHCGTNASNNGQLWRVWIESWIAEAEAKKYRNVIEKLKEKLKE